MSDSLEGFLSVDESARFIRHCRYAVERMMRVLGGWIALTPEVSAKLVMGRHVWDNAQHCDAFGKRLLELRAPAQVSEPANEGVVALMNAIEAAEQPHETVERLVGIYRVLKPHLCGVYGEHLERANAVYEPPTRRVLGRSLEDERRHVAAGETVLRHLAAGPALAQRAADWQGKLEGMLAAAGGVTGRGVPIVAVEPVGRSREAEEFIRLEQAGRTSSIPEPLESALRAFGVALASGDPKAVGAWLVPGVTLDESLLASRRFSTHHVIAFARVGRQRVVKMRLVGARGSATIVTRWIPEDRGWRAAAIEVVRLDPA